MMDGWDEESVFAGDDVCDSEWGMDLDQGLDELLGLPPAAPPAYDQAPAAPPKTIAKGKSTFRVNRKAFGLTYSCPDKADTNPIKDCEALRDFLVDKFGPGQYVIAEEMHKDKDTGDEHATKNHFHVYIKFDKVVQSTDARLFDFEGVHPNIVKGAPGEGWKAYCLGRDDKVQVRNISNIESDPYAAAFALAADGRAEEGYRLLIKKRPRDMALHGRSVRANLMDQAGLQRARILYEGPHLTIPTWTNKSIWVVGEPGTGKTQWAHYVMSHLTNGEYLYCKGTLAALKHLNPRVHKGIIFDDISLPNDWSATDYNTLVDFESDGWVKARYNDVYMPPQMYKIFLSNHDTLDLAKHASVERRFNKFTWNHGMLE